MHEENKEECPRTPTAEDINILESNLQQYYKCTIK